MVVRDGYALQFASLVMRNDYEVVFVAVCRDWQAMAFASQELRENVNFVLNLMAFDWRVVQFASKEVMAHPDVAASAEECAALSMFRSDLAKLNRGGIEVKRGNSMSGVLSEEAQFIESRELDLDASSGQGGSEVSIDDVPSSESANGCVAMSPEKVHVTSAGAYDDGASIESANGGAMEDDYVGDSTLLTQIDEDFGSDTIEADEFDSVLRASPLKSIPANTEGDSQLSQTNKSPLVSFFQSPSDKGPVSKEKNFPVSLFPVGSRSTKGNGPGSRPGFTV